MVLQWVIKMEEEVKKKRGRRKGYHNEPKSYRQEALKAAKDLLYGPEVIVDIRNAKTDAEIEHIMNTARQSSR